MNPFAVPTKDEVAPELIRQGRQLARTQAASGSGNGVIVKKLREIGIEGQFGEEIAADALRVRARFKRIAGFFTILAGMVVIGVGWLLSLFFVARIPIVVAMFGMFLCMIGGVQLFHRAPAKAKGSGSRRLV